MTEPVKDPDSTRRYLLCLAKARVEASGGRPTFVSDMYFQGAEAIETLMAENSDLCAAARALIKYCEDHDWGQMPEPGDTLDRLNRAIVKQRPMVPEPR